MMMPMVDKAIAHQAGWLDQAIDHFQFAIYASMIAK